MIGHSIRVVAAISACLMAASAFTAAAQEPPRVGPDPMAAQKPPDGAVPHRPPADATNRPGGAVIASERGLTFDIPVSSSMSLVHVGSSDSFAITPEGREAASALFAALEALDRQASAEAAQKARAALALYDQIVPRENYGGEYTALQWFADYLIADEAKRAEMTADPFVREFYQLFGANRFEVLKEYLKRKYRIQDIGDEETYTGQMRKAYLEDTILFLNPRRETWEHTAELVRLLDLKPGMTIADLGSGPGYYSFRFASAVGNQGRVFAIDTVADHLKYVEKTKTALSAHNIETIQTDGKGLGLNGRQVDAVFLCSLYHNIYAMSTSPERDAFVESIKGSLKSDGVLYLADNGLVPPGTLPYHGPYVAKELIIAQLVNYGFDLVRQHQHIPQRYLLVFKKAPATATGLPVLVPPAPIPPPQPNNGRL